MPSCMHACTHKATCLGTVTDSFHTHSVAPDNNCAHPHAETIVVRWRDNSACLSSAWAPPCLPVSVGVKRIQLRPDAERERVKEMREKERESSGLRGELDHLPLLFGLPNTTQLAKSALWETEANFAHRQLLQAKKKRSFIIEGRDNGHCLLLL